jgi:uncharacterized protein involved in exopolysaccharide biosynthesis
MREATEVPAKVGWRRDQSRVPQERDWSTQRATSDMSMLRTACQHKWRVGILAVLLVLLPMLVWIMLAPPLYVARLELLVKPGRFESSPEAAVAEATLEAELGSEIGVLRSRGVLEKVALESHLVEREKQGSPEERLARAVRRLEGELKITQVPRTTVIAVRYTDRDPKIAGRVLDSLASSYLEKRSSLYRHPRSVEFFDAQVAKFSEALRDARTGLSQFKERRGISLLNVQKDVNLRRIDELQAEVERLEAEVRGRSQVVAHLDRKRSRSPSRSIEEDFVREEADLVGVKARLGELHGALTRLQERQQVLEAATPQFERLERDVEIAEKNLALYRSRMEEERVENALDRERILRVALVDPAVPPVLPVDRHVPLMLVIVFVAALSAGVGVAVIADRHSPVEVIRGGIAPSPETIASARLEPSAEAQLSVSS